MKKVLLFAYSIAAYLIAFASIMYWILSVSNLIPEISIDQQPRISFSIALLNNILLIALFGVQHSIMARPWFKAFFVKYFPKPIERSTFVLISGLLLGLMVFQWEPMGGIIWEVNSSSNLYYVMYALFFIGWVVLFVSTFIINHFDLFGIRQTFLELQGKPYTNLEFRIKSFYKYVRHPLYFGMLLGMWAATTMTLTHLVFTIGITVYAIIGTWFEERDLVKEFGEQYKLYQQRKPKFIPFTKKKRKGAKFGKPKTMFFFGLLLMVSVKTIAQTISIPDSNFEQALIDLGYDTNGLNGNILQTEAEAVTHLDVHAKNISSLEGIQGFVNITLLKCHGNNLTTLDLSQNTSLENLNCRTNTLTSLDVTNNVQLEVLNCFNNQITALDLSQNIALTSLLSDANNLESLNIRNGNNTNVTFFSAASNSNLFSIEVDYTSYSATNWTSIDAHTSFNEDCSATFAIPDANFEQALIDLGHDTNGLNGNMLYYEAKNIIALDLSNKNINSLEGIQSFSDLTQLFCNSNNLTSLDLSDTPQLIILECNNNNLLNLDVSNNEALTILLCNSNSISNLYLGNVTSLIAIEASNNNLQSIDVSDNINLTELRCENNNINQLDIMNTVSLGVLVCNMNELTSLDLSNHPSLTHLSCGGNNLISLDLKNGNNTAIDAFSAINNPNLLCINVDDGAYSENIWTSIDIQTSFSEDCGGTLGVADVSALDGVTLYPNPSVTNFYIKGLQESTVVSIYNINGRIILKQTISSNQEVSVSEIPAGLYMVNIANNSGTTTKKLIVR